MEKNDSDGFEVPLHRSLTEPILFAGVPRKMALVNGTLMAALAIGAQSLIAIPVGFLFHAIFAALTRIDPNFFEVLVANIRRSRDWQVF